MFSQLFGAFIVNKGLVKESDMNKILNEVSEVRAKLGVIAVAEKILTQDQAEEINHLQLQYDKRFGDIAVEKGYLDETQLKKLLEKQANAYMKFVQLLTQRTNLTIGDVNELLVEFQHKEGFTDDEIYSLKEDDFETLVRAYAFASKPYITNFISLVIRNIVRFVTTDFYFSRIKKVNKLEYAALSGQHLEGNHNISLAFVSPVGNISGMLNLASDFSKQELSAANEKTLDVVAEFTNICNGLFSVELGESDVNVDMLPPFAYVNGELKGNGYVLPIYLHGKLIELFVSIDEDVDYGNNKVSFTVAEQTSSEYKANGKANVMIVDDSLMMRKMLGNILTEAGYSVVYEAVNGKDAIEAYKTIKPDIVTMDITMPEMDGLTALKSIVDMDKNAKVVMITAAGQQHKVIESIKLGALKFIVKPFKKEEVIKAIDEI